MNLVQFILQPQYTDDPENICEGVIQMHTSKVVVRNFSCMVHITVVSRKYAPPFATLASVQNAGGAYTRDATISLVITPPSPPSGTDKE